MGRITDTDMKPVTRMLSIDSLNSCYEIHIDDGVCLSSLGCYDKVMLCKTWMETVIPDKYVSQEFMLYIYIDESSMDYRLKEIRSLIQKYQNISNNFLANNGVYPVGSGELVVNACREMEEYVAEKNGWNPDDIIILDIDIRILDKKDVSGMCRNEIQSLFEKSCE